MKNLAIAVSAYVPIVMILGLADVAAQAASVAEAVALVGIFVLVMGLVWVIFAGGVLLIGLILKKSSVVERGPTGALAQASGGQYARPHDSEQPEARRQSYSGDVQSSVHGEHQKGYSELASINEVVDLSPQQALDEVQTFLVRQGYSIIWRKGESLAMQKHFPDQHVEQNTVNLTVTALHQTEGGVQISVIGNDYEGMKEWQSAWTEWAEGLPKK